METDPHPKSVSPKKPQLGEAYDSWLARMPNVGALERHRNHYDAVSTRVVDSFRESPFWLALLDELNEVDAEYQIKHGYVLLAGQPTIVAKPWKSFLEKSYRHNVLNNKRFPDPPEKDGWLLPPDWHSRIKDVARTTILVRYLDGVPLVVKALEGLSASHGMSSESDLEARMDGYYAAHFLCRKFCEVPSLDWQKEALQFFLEVQVTTQIKELIKKLLHSYYEKSRVNVPAPPSEMPWDYRSDKFKASYLGHILHYVEGMIIDVRDRTRESDA